MASMIDFKRPDGSTCKGYLAEAGHGKPGIVVIQEWWGLNDQIKDGYLADVLLVDGDPLSNLGILRDQKKILAVMKDGTFYKQPEIASARTRWAQSVA